MISPSRVRQLRIADVITRITRKLRLCHDVIYGQHRAFRLLGAMRWLEAHPGASYDDFVAWREEMRRLARALQASLEKRLARVDRIARAT